MKEANSILQIPNDLSPVASFLFRGLGGEIDLNNDSEVALAIRSVLFLYLIILGLAIVTYKLGFAKKLPILKSAVIYAVLAAGCTILTVPLGLSLPIAEGLFVSSLVLGVYRVRLHNERKGRETGAS
ncbi:MULTISPECIES: YlaH-like family protein [Pontibacillus]|uniref:YlaH-like family protein n=1 Tax=Pontibacillus chungwhensis TaxID=265426 RepID=A0ABY8V2Z9_9BACI|nr:MULTISPECIES: YlaH-like family protein [Pontibacillus]MCD5322538.1 YlaH-like family protein [Pontibacillus sp. HN14]WIF99823.1 YlaH-like family protein [Pontibacillus chungwhensis]